MTKKAKPKAKKETSIEREREAEGAKLTKALSEIMEIVKENDLGAIVVISTENLTSYALRVEDVTYSAFTFTKGEDGNVEGISVKEELRPKPWVTVSEMINKSLALFNNLTETAKGVTSFMVNVTEALTNSFGARMKAETQKEPEQSKETAQ